MAIETTDLLMKFSIKTGAAGNSASSAPATSLGKYISTTQITDASLNNLFDNVSASENAASNVEYRCIFIHNNHATLTLQNAVVWIYAVVSGGAVMEIAVDDLPDSAIGASGAQADEIADEDTAPGTGVGAFSAPTTKATGLALGDIAPGYCRAIWVKRSANNTSALSNDGGTIKVEGDTEP